MLAGLSVTTLINLKTGQRAAKASAPRVFRLQAHFTIHGERTAPGGIDESKERQISPNEEVTLIRLVKKMEPRERPPAPPPNNGRGT